MKFDLLDAMVLIGWLAITAGLALLHVAAALIGGGVLLMGLGLYMAHIKAQIKR